MATIAIDGIGDVEVSQNFAELSLEDQNKIVLDIYNSYRNTSESVNTSLPTSNEINIDGIGNVEVSNDFFQLTKPEQDQVVIDIYNSYKNTDSKPVRLAKSFGQGAISAIKNTYDFLKMKNPTLFGTEKTGIDFIDNRDGEDKIAKALDVALEKTTVQDPTFDEKVSSGFGSMASFLIPGLGFARTARAAQAAPKVAALLGTSAMGVVEASAEAGGTYNEALAMGKTEDEAQRDANQTFFANIPANILLNQGLLSKIPEGEKIRKALTQAGKEATQEFVQQVISNVAVDDEFGIESFEGAGESALIGGIVGGGVSGVGSALSKDSPTTTIEQQAQPIEESEKIEIDKMANAKELVKNVKSLGKKYLTSSGAMPKDIYQIKTKADSRLNAELQELKFTNFDFQKAQSKIEFNENDIESMNMALEGKASLVGKLEPLQDSLKKMRTHIDKLSQQMIDEGVVEGDLVGVVDKNKGFYVTRAYQVHDDPNWSKKVPEDVRNRAKAFIRKNMTKDVYDFYNENQSLGVGKAKDFQLTKDANKIQKFKDDLSGKVDRLRTRIDSKLNLEQDKLQTQFKEKTFLEANKKRTPKYTERGIKVNTNRLNKLQQILKDSRAEFKALGKTLGIEDVATREQSSELTPQQESIVLRRTRLLKREIKTAEKIENEIDRIKNEIQTIANQNLKRKQTELKSKIERQKSRIDKREADIDALYDLINELDAMKKEYTQGVLNIAFMHKSQYTNRFGEIYDIRDPEMQKKLEYVGLTENNIEGFTEALITEQQQMYRGLLTKENAKALGILKKRKEIPLEIRELWGQYLDPSATYAKSIDRMATLISKHEFLSEARDIGMGTYFFEKPEGREFSVRIKGESNPLAGLYTSRDIAEAMDGLNEVQGLGSNFMKLYYSGIAATKYMKTIGSFKTQVRNFVSGFQFMVMQGNIPLKPKDLKAFQEALKISRTQILNSTNQELRDKVIELKRIGLIEGELQTSELKALYKDAGLMEKFFDPSTTEGSTAKKKLKRLKYLLEVPASFYQAGDNVWKMVQFEMEKAKYKKAMPELSESELQKIAVENVRGTMQYYSLSSFAAKKLNRNPVIGTFALFWAETLRIQANSIRLINKELKNPKLRAIGMRRLVGFMVGSQMWKIIAKAGAMGLGLAAKGFTDEDEENMKRFDASWERNTNKLYTKIDKENGIYNFIDMSAYDIYGAQNKAIYALFGGEQKEALKEFFKPVADLDIFTKSMVEAISNKDLETGKEIGPSDKTIQRIIVHAGKDFLPGSLNDAQRIIKSFNEEANIYGRRYDTSIEVGAALGYRETSRDIGKSLGFKIKNFNVQERKITGKKTEDEVRETKMARYESLHKDMIAAEKLGVSQSRIRQIARLSGLQGRKFNVIYYGNYDSYINQSIRKSNIRKRKKESMIETAYPYNKE
jgi:hypothetical protein